MFESEEEKAMAVVETRGGVGRATARAPPPHQAVD
jgi:hypothetical protein